MNISIVNENDKNITLLAFLCHDDSGNIILKIHETYHALFINEKNNIEFFEIYNYNNLPNTNKNIQYNKINNIIQEKTLKSKITKEIEDIKCDYNDEIELDYENDIQKYKICPEDKLFVVEDEDEDKDEDKDDNDENFDDFEIYYKFSKSGNKNIITCLEKTLDSPPIYDTFVINDNNNTVLVTMQSNEQSAYRIIFYTSGKIGLNIIGSKINIYYLEFNEENNEILIKSKFCGFDIV